ncbi:unnamed protein product [Sympodiomycopsis kandeliae]
MGLNNSTQTAESSYWSSREALIAQERSRRFDYVKSSSLNPVEVEANKIIESIKNEEAQTLWNSETNLKNFPGMPLREALNVGLRDTKIWQMIRKLPKGALLHCHMDGTVEANWLIQEALKYQDIFHVRAQGVLNQDTLYTHDVTFAALPVEDQGVQYNGDVFAEDYDGHQWMSLREARKRFPINSVYDPAPVGLVDGIDIPKGSTGTTPEGAFDAWLHSLMTMIPCPGSKPVQTSPEAWDRFMSTFGIIGGFIAYEPVLRSYIKQMIISHASDGVSYIETRLNFLDEFYLATDAKTQIDHTRWVEIFQESLAEAKAECDKLGYTFLDAKIIYATVRFITPDKLQWYLNDCIQLKQKFPEKIIGFDLVGYEDPLMTLKEYVPELLAFQEKVKNLGLEIPFIFHAGETLGDGNKTDQNLYDAILLGTKRIGHGYSLVKHPILMEMCKERKICIESCPISNEVLAYTPSVAQHPLPILLNHGLHVALSNDDACQFGNPGLSYDFYQVFTASKASTIASLYTLAKTSIDHSRLTDKERQVHLETFEKQWAQFCSWVVKEFGQQN